MLQCHLLYSYSWGVKAGLHDLHEAELFLTIIKINASQVSALASTVHWDCETVILNLKDSWWDVEHIHAVPCGQSQSRVFIPCVMYYETYVCTTFVGCPTQSHSCCLALYYVCILLCVHIVHVNIWCLLGMCTWWCSYVLYVLVLVHERMVYSYLYVCWIW